MLLLSLLLLMLRLVLLVDFVDFVGFYFSLVLVDFDVIVDFVVFC